MMNKKLIYFYISYLLFFFLILLFYELSAFLTVSTFPTPFPLFYTPLTPEIFLGIQFLGIPLLFIILFLTSREGYVIGLLVVYFTFLVIFYLFPNIYALFSLALVGIGLFASVIPNCISRLSKVLWGISSLYYVMIIVNYIFSPSLQFYPIFIIPSVIASGIEIMKVRQF
ncbi:hypothetical protein [Stygiolobus azoricus]|uniref:Uncharacterized protein n=1 Tax=Stygiolobus azoricus TaxID=41675 RepID=A0A650CPJ9_9CREN|nr:hypothetical protein [Stygiolobus azoricus]QGR19635.1 hypothetical protein D1868_06250 [Stygiolobus azoricus]